MVVLCSQRMMLARYTLLARRVAFTPLFLVASCPQSFRHLTKTDTAATVDPFAHHGGPQLTKYRLYHGR